MNDQGRTDILLVTVGRVLKEWALKGELLVLPLTFDPRRFLKLSRVALEFERKAPKVKKKEGAAGKVAQVPSLPPGSNNTIEWKEIKSVKFHNDLLIICFNGCETPEEAKKLRGALIKIDKSESPELPEGVYYQYQIIGLSVYTVNDDYLGEVKDIMEAGGNEIYVVDGNGREYLIPAISEFVKQIDLASKKIVVELMEYA